MHTTLEKITKRLKAPIRFLKNRRRMLHGLKNRNMVRVFWWEDYANFGDDLNRVITLRFGCTPVRAATKNADVVMIGSVLDLIPDNYAGAILGSGFRSAGEVRQLTNANVIAVRGNLTADRLAIPVDSRTLGDPGLLVSRFFEKQPAMYKLGLVPHLSERNHNSFKRLKARFGKDCLFVDPRQSGDEVVRQIAQCASIFSSSLHGLVTADALGIPSRWIHLSEETIPAFKFHDYYSAFDEKRIPIQIDGGETLQALLDLALAPPARVEEVTGNLEACLTQFLSSFKLAHQTHK